MKQIGGDKTGWSINESVYTHHVPFTNMDLLQSLHGRVIIGPVEMFLSVIMLHRSSFDAKLNFWLVKNGRISIDGGISDFWAIVILVHWQSDGCRLTNKDGAVTRDSFRQVAACRFIILEIAVDGRRCPHTLPCVRSVCADFVLWSWNGIIVIEFDRSFMSGDHAFGHVFNEVVLLWIVLMCL